MLNRTFFILMSAFILSCSDDEIKKPDEEIKDTREMITCDIDFVVNYPGTACCVWGPAEAAPNETLGYHYESNFNDAVFIWTVLSGSITIVGGQGTATVSLKFGSDFNGGSIIGLGDGELKGCSEKVDIKKMD